MLISIRGNEYNVSVIGKGEAIVLLHGFTGDGRTWDDLAPDLSSSRQVVIIDLLGHGKTASPLDSELYTIQRAADDIWAILDRLKIEKAHFLGYSMGGRLALAITVLFPNRVSSLILESTSPGLRSQIEREQRILQDEKLAELILSDGITAFVDKWENIPLFSTQKFLPEKIRMKIKSQRLENNPLGLANSLRGMGTGRQPSFWNELHDLKIPVLILCGELDEKFCAIGNEMERLLPQSKQIIFKGAGHAIHVEEPQKFDTIVKEYLDNLCFHN